ncbi:hypothetical protein CANARDRAFT_186957, partial [[Candida] arabinofermentans NRRL YB-2248]
KANQFHTSIISQGPAKLTKKGLARQRREKNIALQHTRKLEKEKVDPVLGRPNNPFLNRIKLETQEPGVLTRGFQIHEVEKLLHGAKEAKILKSESLLGYDEEAVKRIAIEEEEKKNIILRILNIKNSSVYDERKQMIKLAASEFARFEGDTGSSEVQAAVMTVKLHTLMTHIKQNPQDVHQIRKARMLTQQRQRILRYLKLDNPERYFWSIEKLGLTDECVHMEFNFDKRYMDDFQIWPGRQMVKLTKLEREDKQKQRR